MDTGQPSRTAQEVALSRALHQVLDRPPVFDDPLALRILGGEGEAALRADPRGVPSRASIRAFIAARSRYAEDRLARAVASGVRQYVILGAGLDTFAYRNPHAAAGLRVFEVDHPATQAWKRRRLRETGIPNPDGLCFVPLDLARDALDQGLGAAGFRADRPAVVSMLGMVIFMPRRAVIKMLGFVASLPQGSGVAFDYGVPDDDLDADQRALRQIAARWSAGLGEPFRTFLDPGALAADLRRMGFTHIDDCGPDAINRRYFENRDDGLCVGPGGRRLLGARR